MAVEAEQAARRRCDGGQATWPAPARRATGRLADGIRALGGARSLSEVLDTLVSCAGQEASRAGVLLVRGDRFPRLALSGFRSPI